MDFDKRGGWNKRGGEAKIGGWKWILINIEVGINKDGGKLKWILINMEVGIYL